MIDDLPMSINAVFILTTVMTVLLFVKASQRSVTVFVFITAWLAFQLYLGLSGFYQIVDTFPPRFLLLGVPPALVIFGLFLSNSGKAFIDRLDIKHLTYLHTIRVPVELVLFWLFLSGQIPQLMTFEGRNFDIVAGLTAPVIGFLIFSKNKLGNKTLLLWNLICIALLINIIVLAVLSAPTQLQQFAFDQPNVAVLHFPFVWLPSCVVPIVLFSHMASIRQLLKPTSA